MPSRQDLTPRPGPNPSDIFDELQAASKQIGEVCDTLLPLYESPIGYRAERADRFLGAALAEIDAALEILNRAQTA